MSDMNSRQDLVKIAQRLAERNLNSATGGNISVRTLSGFYITPSGINKGFLEESEIVELDKAFKPIKNGVNPSSELGIHRHLYTNIPSTNAIIHCHPIYSTIFALLGRSPITKILPEAFLILGEGVPVVPYGTPSTQELVDNFSNFLPDNSIFIMRNHGIVAVGSDIYDAYNKIELLESVSRINYLLTLMGEDPGAYSLEEGNLAELLKLFH